MIKESANINELILNSKMNTFPLKIKFVGEDNTITDYVLYKTRKGKLILQKPFFNSTVLFQE